ncbi:MAG: hypothetical protein V1735_00580 [Nanoarchaeota archaeon]
MQFATKPGTENLKKRMASLLDRPSDSSDSYGPRVFQALDRAYSPAKGGYVPTESQAYLDSPQLLAIINPNMAIAEQSGNPLTPWFSVPQKEFQPPYSDGARLYELKRSLDNVVDHERKHPDAKSMVPLEMELSRDAVAGEILSYVGNDYQPEQTRDDAKNLSPKAVSPGYQKYSSRLKKKKPTRNSRRLLSPITAIAARFKGQDGLEARLPDEIHIVTEDQDNGKRSYRLDDQTIALVGQEIMEAQGYSALEAAAEVPALYASTGQPNYRRFIWDAMVQSSRNRIQQKSVMGLHPNDPEMVGAYGWTIPGNNVGRLATDNQLHGSDFYEFVLFHELGHHSTPLAEYDTNRVTEWRLAPSLLMPQYRPEMQPRN